MNRTYKLFISHSWTYSNQYDGLVNLLRKDPYFHFHNYSVPKDDPIHNASNDRQLCEAIKLAEKGFNITKPIIAVEYWGSERTSIPVKNAAKAVVKWQSQSIINAIKEVVR